MAPAPPVLDPRDAAEILRQADALRPLFTPEWQGPPEGDPGRALLEAFARLLEGSIERLNRAPTKAFLAFLDLIGARLLPAQAARAPLTFLLSSGADRPVRVPARSQAAAAAPPGGRPVVFETEEELVATPAALTALLSVALERDQVFDHLASLAAGDTAALWDEGSAPDLQEHTLYLGHADLFRVSGPARLELRLTPFDRRLASSAVRWQASRKGTAGTAWNDLGTTVEGDSLSLAWKGPGSIDAVEVGGLETRWIRATVVPGRLPELTRLQVGQVLASVRTGEATGSDDLPAGLAPEAAVSDDVELDPQDPFYPFGRRPRRFGAFYLASAEAFSKRGARIVLNFDVALEAEPTDDSGVEEPSEDDRVKPSDDLELSWEYWDGKGWRRIPGLDDQTDRLSAKGAIEFTCPDDLAPTEVLGQTSHWIRARIVAGDYGRETYSLANGQVTATPDFHPPRVERLRLAYHPELAPLEAVLTVNALTAVDRTALAGAVGTGRARETFEPFIPLEGGGQALYLGFDRPLESGPLSLFFILEEQEYAEGGRPRVEWQYFRRRDPRQEGEWARLEVEEGTSGLTESGTVRFLAPADPGRTIRFGVDGYWLRAVDVESRFRPPAASVLRRPAPTAPAGSGRLPCALRDPRAAALRELPHPSLATREQLDTPAAPRLRGLHLNTAWAVQSETVANEILGSSPGLAGQTYTLSRAPVADEAVWVDELGSLSEGERSALSDAPGATTEVQTGADGALTRFWVLWRPVDDLDEAGPADRVYAIDQTFGVVSFGDGERGAVPPPGRDNLHVTYRSGGGAAGNVAAGAISALRSTVPLVDKVTNPAPASGGAETEELERAAERGPQAIADRDRAVTRSDYEWLAREASQAVARVRCLPRFDDQGEAQSNWVTVVIAPDSAEPRPTPSPVLRRRVERYLRSRAAAVTVFPVHVRVIGPAYVEVRVTAELFPLSIDLAPTAELAAGENLRQFLHPLTGGYEGRGWEFGRLPCLSDLFALLEATEGVDHVGSLSMTLQPVGPAGEAAGAPLEVTPSGPENLALPDYALVASGEHAVTSRLAE